MDFAANPDLNLSGSVRAEFDRIVSELSPTDIAGWLHGERPLITPLLRWARTEALAKIEAFVEAGPSPEEDAAPSPNFAEVAQRVFP
ncbi:hypothetical protein, partial [Mesorhizobium mediterraneum]|uniref:hypothetical protein n=1 Tax=Mesorhizobium mediterraneum TaxID=43617 RepID=UPI001AEDD251